MMIHVMMMLIADAEPLRDSMMSSTEPDDDVTPRSAYHNRADDLS